MKRTHTPLAPWFTVEAEDSRFRDLSVGRILLESLQARLARPPSAKALENGSSVVSLVADGKREPLLDRVDLSQTLSSRKYRKQVPKYQGELSRLVWQANEKRISTVIVFEGWDAAGKGSCIRRITEAMDPRLYRLIPVAAPSDEERSHHYLWRFWRFLPRSGMVTIFDRSWYGRVLVERVEGFAKPNEWRRAFAELRDFEDQLVEHGTVILKFWIHISKEEQLQRFQRRQEVPYKQHKITDEDWRNRKKWASYESAVNDMVAQTSTPAAPWTLVAGNDKKFARMQILKTVCRRLEAVL